MAAVDLASVVRDKFLFRLKHQLGVKTVIRYYDNAIAPTKTPLDIRENNRIARSGLALAVVFQHNQRFPSSYTPARAEHDAARSLFLAKQIHQPRGSAIYFGIEGADKAFEDEHLLPGDKYGDGPILSYFGIIHRRITASGFKVGVYGSGRSCELVRGAKYASYCWFAAPPRRWPGRVEMLASGHWHLKQHLTTRSCGKPEFDFNEVKTRDFGQWKPKVISLH